MALAGFGNNAFVRSLMCGRCGQHWPASGLMKPPNTGLGCGLLDARAQVTRNQRPALACIEKEDRFLGLDKIDNPILNTILPDCMFVKSTGPTLVVLRDQVEATVLGRAMRGR